MLDPLVYEARRTRLLFVALVLGLGLVALVVQGGGATEAVPREAARRPLTVDPKTEQAASPTTSTTRPASLEAPATLLVSAEETTTTAPRTTAPPTTEALRAFAAPPPTTAPPPTAPPTTAPRPTNAESGTATWYEGGSSGGCAHLTLPMGTTVTVTAMGSGRQVTCTVDDRGPFGRHIIDLSPSGFQALAPLSSGVISVRISW